MKTILNSIPRIVLLTCFFSLGVPASQACRVGSERLKSYTRASIEKILNLNNLKSLYWPNEPLDVGNLVKVMGINISLAETNFDLDVGEVKSAADDGSLNELAGQTGRSSLIQDMFVSCSADRDRSYTLTINLELDNPFKVIDVRFKEPQANSWGLFQIRLPQSSFLVQLNQRISYDECLDIKYVQFSPNVEYQVDCVACTEAQRVQLDKIFNKRMTQLDSELDSILSEKLLLGLQILLSQQRLDLDLFLI